MSRPSPLLVLGSEASRMRSKGESEAVGRQAEQGASTWKGVWLLLPTNEVVASMHQERCITTAGAVGCPGLSSQGNRRAEWRQGPGQLGPVGKPGSGIW